MSELHEEEMNLEDWLYSETDDTCAVCGIKRAKTSPIFDKVRPQVQALLDRLMQEIREDAGKTKQSIENLRCQCDSLLPEGKQKMLLLCENAERQLEQARTYNDYVLDITAANLLRVARVTIIVNKCREFWAARGYGF